MPARRTGDFRLRFHDALAPAAPPGLSSVGGLSVNGCSKPATSPDGEPPVTGGVAAASVMPQPMRSIGSRVHTTCSGHRRTGRVGSGRCARLDRHLLDLGGTYGRPGTGDPIQYDELRIEHDQGAVEIVVYNRALLLFVTDSEAVRRMSDRRIRLIDLRGR